MSALNNLLSAALPKPRPLSPRRSRAKAVNKVLVLCEGQNPTYAFYFHERLQRLNIPFEVVFQNEKLRDVSPEGLYVIIVRYVRPAALRWLFIHRQQFAGVALFVDDDLAATVASSDADLAYRLHVLRLGILPLPALNRVLTDLWVSTDALKSAIRDGELVKPYPPAPSESDLKLSLCQQNPSPVASKVAHEWLVAFHASGAHHAEHRFLVPVVEYALQNYDNLYFEIFAEKKIAESWAISLRSFSERVVIRQPIAWEAYTIDRTLRQRHIVLVPLLNSPVNSVRADTKRADIVALKAAAIFSKGPVYERCKIEGEIFAGNDPREWFASIDLLLTDSSARLAAMDATVRSIGRMRAEASVALPGLEPYFLRD